MSRNAPKPAYIDATQVGSFAEWSDASNVFHMTTGITIVGSLSSSAPSTPIELVPTDGPVDIDLGEGTVLLSR
jgi:hypothetical protein